MNTKLLLSLVAAALFSLSAHAHDCSGGADGGMDATGNQCNDAATALAAPPSDRGKSSSSHFPQVDAAKAASCTTCGRAHRRHAKLSPRRSNSAEAGKDASRLARAH